MLLPALPYHNKVRDHFKQHPAIWAEFAGGVRVEHEAAPAVGWQKDTAAPEPHGNPVINLYTFPDEELAIADRIVAVIANYCESTSSLPGTSVAPSDNTIGSLSPYYETARRWRLYTQIYCDRAAGILPGDPAQEQHHPDHSIRSRALRLWHEHPETAEAAIVEMVEGAPELDRLDIFAQKELEELTREFLQHYLSPAWFQSAPVKGLAGQYFREGFMQQPAGPQQQEPRSALAPAPEPVSAISPVREPGSSGTPDLEAMTTAIADAHDSIKKYFSYLLLDFALVDPSLQEAPAGRAFQLAEAMQLADPYASIVKKELQFNDKKLQQYKQQAHTAYAAAGPSQ